MFIVYYPPNSLHYLSGAGRGFCKCGECVCKDDYLGENCGKVNCTIAAKNCLSSNRVSRELLE